MIRRHRRQRLSRVFTAAFLLATIPAVSAATRTWTGASFAVPNVPHDAAWMNQFNWSGNAAPVAGDDLVLGSGNQITSLNNFANFTSFNTLNLSNSHSAIGNSIALTAGLSIANATLGVTSVKLNNSQTFTAPTNGVAATISSNVDTNGKILTVAGPGILTLSGVISGVGAVQRTGTGTLTLGGTAANTSTTSVWSQEGTIVFGKPDGVNASRGDVIAGDGAGTASSAIIRLGHNEQIADTSIVNVNADGLFDLSNFTETISNLTVAQGKVTIGTGSLRTNVLSMSGGTVSSSGAGSLKLGGNATLSSPAQINSTIDLLGAVRTFEVTGAATTIVGVIANGGLTKTGSGTLELAGPAGTYTGATTVSAGTLMVDSNQSSSAVLVNGGTLTGIGTVGPVSATGGVVRAGLYALSGTNALHINGNVALNAAATATFPIYQELGGATRASQWQVTGGVSLGGSQLTLELFQSPTLTIGQTFLLIANDGSDAVAGEFAGKPEGSKFIAGSQAFTISYHGGDGNDVVITVAPAGRTWTGASVDISNLPAGSKNNLWTNQFNWSNNAAPVVGEDLVLGSGVNAHNLSNNDFGAGTLFNTLALSGGHVAAGQSISLKAGLTAFAAQLSLTSITLTGSQTFSAPTPGGAATITSSIGLNNNTLTFDGPGILDITGGVSGTGTLRKTGAGTATLGGSSANTYSAAVFVDDGVLQLNKPAGVNAIPNLVHVGGGSGAANSAVLRQLQAEQIGNTAQVTVNADGDYALNNFSETFSVLSLNGGLVDIGQGELDLPFLFLNYGSIAGTTGKLKLLDPNFPSPDGDVSVEGSSFISARVDLGGATRKFYGNGFLSLSGVVSNGGITKVGQGKLSLFANNTYTGPTTVSEGRLQVDGTQPGSAVTVNGGSLIGTGTIGDLTGLSGSFKPSISVGHDVVFRVNGNLSFNSNFTYQPGFSGGNVPSKATTSVAGTVSLGGSNLDLQIVQYSFAVGDVITIIAHDGTDPIQGEFAGKPEGSSFLAGTTKFVISYHGGDGNDVTLTVAEEFNPPPTTLANISTRLRVETGDNVLIGGFIVTGTQPKKVIIRAIGTSLPFADKLANPVLELHGPNGLIDSNDNWVDSPNKQAIINSTIPPSSDLESAIVQTLPANNTGYTAIVRGVNGGTGIGLVEAYDLDTRVDSRLANISTRGFVQTGDNVLIAGTIIVGQSPQKVIVRAIGPSLAISGRMEDPSLELRDGNGTLLEANDNWVDSLNKQAIIDSTIPPANDLESAIVHTLPPAAYTAIVRGVNGTTGIAVVEVYALQ